jgi:hypothetical protein
MCYHWGVAARPCSRIFEHMADNIKLRDAIETLLDQLKEQEREIRETKKTINMLHRRMGEEPAFDDVDETPGFSVAIRADEYYGKPLLAAVQMILERGKRARSGEEILSALEQGGFDFIAQGWKDNDRLRSLSIALAKNPQVIHRLPNGTYGLRAWYDENMLKRARAARNGDEEESDE